MVVDCVASRLENKAKAHCMHALERERQRWEGCDAWAFENLMRM